MITSIENIEPQIHETAYIAKSAEIIGDVEIGEGSSIWNGAVCRGDLNSIRIGKNTNIQDNSVLHTGYKEALVIGDNVTVGHMVCLHGCSVLGNSVIGIGSIIMNGAMIEENCIVGAGTLIPQGKRILKGSVVIGNPYSILREVNDKDIEYIKKNALEYRELSKKYKKQEEN